MRKSYKRRIAAFFQIICMLVTLLPCNYNTYADELQPEDINNIEVNENTEIIEANETVETTDNCETEEVLESTITDVEQQPEIISDEMAINEVVSNDTYTFYTRTYQSSEMIEGITINAYVGDLYMDPMDVNSLPSIVSSTLIATSTTGLLTLTKSEIGDFTQYPYFWIEYEVPEDLQDEYYVSDWTGSYEFKSGINSFSSYDALDAVAYDGTWYGYLYDRGISYDESMEDTTPPIVKSVKFLENGTQVDRNSALHFQVDASPVDGYVKAAFVSYKYTSVYNVVQYSGFETCRLKYNQENGLYDGTIKRPMYPEQAGKLEIQTVSVFNNYGSSTDFDMQDENGEYPYILIEEKPFVSAGIPVTNFNVAWEKSDIILDDEHVTDEARLYVTWDELENQVKEAKKNGKVVSSAFFSLNSRNMYMSSGCRPISPVYNATYDENRKAMVFTLQVDASVNPWQYYIDSIIVELNIDGGRVSAYPYFDKYEKLNVITKFTDYMPPKVEVSIDKQAEVLSAGDMATVSVKVTDDSNIILDGGIEHPHIVLKNTSNDPYYSNAGTDVELKYDLQKGVFIAEIDTSDFKTGEWYISNVVIYDNFYNLCSWNRSSCSVEHYFIVERPGEHFNNFTSSAKFLFWSNEIGLVYSYEKTFTNRTKLKELLDTYPTLPDDPDYGKFVGWYSDMYGFVNENTPIVDPSKYGVYGDTSVVNFRPIFEKVPISVSYVNKNKKYTMVTKYMNYTVAQTTTREVKEYLYKQDDIFSDSYANWSDFQIILSGGPANVIIPSYSFYGSNVSAQLDYERYPMSITVHYIDKNGKLKSFVHEEVIDAEQDMSEAYDNIVMPADAKPDNGFERIESGKPYAYYIEADAVRKYDDTKIVKVFYEYSYFNQYGGESSKESKTVGYYLEGDTFKMSELPQEIDGDRVYWRLSNFDYEGTDDDSDFMSQYVDDDFVVTARAVDGYALFIQGTNLPPRDVKVKKVNVSVYEDGSLGLNFYIKNNSSQDVELFSAEVGFKDDIQEADYYEFSDLEYDETTELYKVSYKVNSGELTRGIKLTISDNGFYEYTDRFEYSVKDYIDTIMNNPAYSKYVPLLKAMLNYGAASQTYFGIGTNKLANASLSATDKQLAAIPQSELTKYNVSTSAKLGDVEYIGTSLLLKSDVIVRHYFKLAAGTNMEDYTFKYSGADLEPQEKSGYYYIEFAVPATKIMDNYTITIAKGSNSCNLTYSPMTYVAKASSNTDTKLVKLMNALYAYAKAM